MAQITTTINVCDRCGHAENPADYMKGNVWGQMSVGWKGDTGGRCWDGAAGGLNHLGRAWLCMSCTEAFLAFMRPIAPPKDEQPKGQP